MTKCFNEVLPKDGDAARDVELRTEPSSARSGLGLG
jgi:hypothetical protein